MVTSVIKGINNQHADTLLTDLYELTMLQGYFEQKMNGIAVFEFFVRRLPNNRGFLIAAGLEQVLQYFETFRFTTEELDWLAASKRFNNRFIDYLSTLRFNGDVYAMPEGTVFFPDEPILRVVAPLPEAQIVESRLINLLHFQTVIASKAVRCVLMAADKLLVDFGMRRAHGAEAALLAARASYLAGFSGSATVLAAKEFGIPIFGTMAHSFIQAHDDELSAFEHFAKAQPENVVLLIDTYNTEEGAKKVVKLAPRLKRENIKIKAVRLDSGDLASHAKKVRSILDQGGLEYVTIFSSGGIDEYQLNKLLKVQAPIDGFGIGTNMDTSADAPCLDCAYKLQEYAAVARRKQSEGKATWPGRKQVFRQKNKQNIIVKDVLTLENEQQEGEPLIQPVMKNGKRIQPAKTLDEIREKTKIQLACLPEPLRELETDYTYPVYVSQSLKDLSTEVDKYLESSG